MRRRVGDRNIGAGHRDYLVLTSRGPARLMRLVPVRRVPAEGRGHLLEAGHRLGLGDREFFGLVVPPPPPPDVTRVPPPALPGLLGIPPAPRGRGSRAAHAASRVVPAAPGLAGVFRGRTPRSPGACAGAARQASPRASTLRAAFASAWSSCPQATHRNTAWLSRFSAATWPHLRHCCEE